MLTIVTINRYWSPYLYLYLYLFFWGRPYLYLYLYLNSDTCTCTCTCFSGEGRTCTCTCTCPPVPDPIPAPSTLSLPAISHTSLLIHHTSRIQSLLERWQYKFLGVKTNIRGVNKDSNCKRCTRVSASI